MATQPTNDLLIWANTDVNLPNLTGPNKTEPSADLVAKGWDFKQKPSADEFNYILNNLSKWVEYLITLTAEGTPLNTPSTLVERDADGNFAASMIASDLTGNVTGNADTATKWQIARTLTLTGSVNGSASIDGSGNISVPISISSSSGITILTGTVAHGGTIPLPSGFIESQCKWFVSVNSLYSGQGSDDIDLFVCSADTARVVTCSGSNGNGSFTGVANYIIVGVK